MFLRLAALAVILAGTTAAWMILGVTIVARTDQSDAQLRGKVESVWGSPQEQRPPTATFGPQTVAPTSTDVDGNIQLDYRQKGLLWYSTFKVAFRGDYEFANDAAEASTMQILWKFPAQKATYDTLEFFLNNQQVQPQLNTEGALIQASIPAGQKAQLRVAYRTQGLDSWTYKFGDQISSVPNFHLRMTTNFKDVDFLNNSLAPTAKQEAGSGWQLDWNYQNLYSGDPISVQVPEKIQPGPLASRISFFAPVSLLFFFVLIFMITTLRGIDLHPMNYFFMACAFFAFHLLLAYLADHVDIYVAFGLSAIVSVALVVSYLRIVTGLRFAIREAAITQVIYLVLFSFAFFFQGYTGLAITVGAIVTLFVAMQMTGRIQWAEKFSRTNAVLKPV